jgi:hypothetical protein
VLAPVPEGKGKKTPVIAQAGAPDAGHYTAQYELLRAEVLGTGRDALRPEAVGRPRLVGLAIMLREGMPGWLNAIEAVIRTSLAPSAANAGRSPAMASAEAKRGAAPGWLAGVPRHDLTALLASLVLSTRRVECASPREECLPCH